MISFSVVFFPLTFFLLCSLPAVSESFYLHFFHSSPTLSRSRLIQIHFAISVSFFASISPLLSGYLLSLPVFHLPFFDMTSSCAPNQFLLRTSLHSNLHSLFIIFLLSALLPPTIILTRLSFANMDLLLLFLCQCHRL